MELQNVNAIYKNFKSNSFHFKYFYSFIGISYSMFRTYSQTYPHFLHIRVISKGTFR